MQIFQPFSETDLIGSSQTLTSHNDSIMQIDFITPVKVSAGIERISRS
jgi:hypothetical protein